MDPTLIICIVLHIVVCVEKMRYTEVLTMLYVAHVLCATCSSDTKASHNSIQTAVHKIFMLSLL